jgi:hypothetical protein
MSTPHHMFRDSALSRTTRAFFAFLFRNALPVEPTAMLDADDDITRRRQLERARAGVGLVRATTYRPDGGISLHGVRSGSWPRGEDSTAKSARA